MSTVFSVERQETFSSGRYDTSMTHQCSRPPVADTATLTMCEPPRLSPASSLCDRRKCRPLFALVNHTCDASQHFLRIAADMHLVRTQVLSSRLQSQHNDNTREPPCSLRESVCCSLLWPRHLPFTPTSRVPAKPAPDEAQLAEHGHYVNKDGHTVHSPAHAKNGAIPSGATARCRDGTYSFSQHHRGTCSHHGGVASWL